ncbi:carbon-nitrogen hydrolase family protein [Croceicoccus sp. F390]|uniref:Carbon-nitrogen hydrolase family protein n=1 Tax=Croceicoccus esteveae TaxID=3075597 RepID=A0ABU2ZFU3_9SPHN|nr:carbon-nitrogen hydrolase family protein [Croceicoccus sp. F390]MDT0575472.1 carbon-nitrogen hydrolase family protein [Croceicoccus sp. F390]
MRIALYQANTGIDPATNAADVEGAIRQAADGGAKMLFTPEMVGLLDRQRSRAAAAIKAEADDPVLGAACAAAARHRIWVTLGSVAIRRGDGRLVNRSFVIDAAGRITARYDKIHMFDVDLDDGEQWRESAVYAAGNKAVSTQTPLGLLGLSICYDLRFPALFAALGDRHCDVIAVPAAFTVPTGQAHWHVLLRARAIEASAWVIAAAQEGGHEDGRSTYGHSLVVDPWGKVVLDMGSAGKTLGFAEVDLERTEAVRRQIPSLANRQVVDTAAPS